MIHSIYIIFESLNAPTMGSASFPSWSRPNSNSVCRSWIRPYITIYVCKNVVPLEYHIGKLKTPIVQKFKGIILTTKNRH